MVTIEKKTYILKTNKQRSEELKIVLRLPCEFHKLKSDEVCFFFVNSLFFHYFLTKSLRTLPFTYLYPRPLVGSYLLSFLVKSGDPDFPVLLL